jgi:dTDP-glucose 4,6-dehydratase
MKGSKTILVTGGAGFIASNFVRYILEKYTNYRVLVLDCLSYAGNPDNFNSGVMESARFSFWYGNVRNPDIVNTLVSQSDVVVHMAAETHVARSIYDNAVFFETDVLGTQVVANAVLKNRNVERFIHVSTSEVYGTALTEPMTEEHPLNAASPYASAKTGADRLVYSYYLTYGIPAIIVRPFNNYGHTNT